MTREQFVNKKFKGYMLIDFKHPEVGVHECMLCGVNYDTEMLFLRPFPGMNPFEEEEFWVHISSCEVSRPQLKVIKR